MSVGLSPATQTPIDSQPITLGLKPIALNNGATIAAFEKARREFPTIDFTKLISGAEGRKDCKGTEKSCGQNADKFARAEAEGQLLDVANADAAMTILHDKFDILARDHPQEVQLKPIQRLCRFNAKVTGILISKACSPEDLRRTVQDHINFLDGCNKEFSRNKTKPQPATTEEARTRCNTAVEKCLAELAKWEAQAVNLK